MKKTKIVATIGPATESEIVMEQMIKAGLNVARFNTKHADPVWHNERIQRIKNVAARMGVPVGVLVDLQGPEIRINVPEEKPFDVKQDDIVVFTSDEKLDLKNIILVPQVVISALKTGNQVLLDDGACEFSVSENMGNYLTATALVDCTIGHRKTMNTPGVILDMPSLTERDFAYLDGIKPELVDFVGLSFVRNANDVEILRSELTKRGFTADIVSKIENQAAIDNIEEIISHSEAIMVARGDLGVEVPYQELIRWQKMLIDSCRVAGKPVITATQMLKSMMKNPRPTRAEVSDVAHAIYDGTDAVMLSDETTIGAYPVKCIAVQAEISTYNEPFVQETLPQVFAEKNDLSESIAEAVIHIVESTDLNVTNIICLTETGRTAKLIARHRPSVAVTALTSNQSTINKLSLVYGVTSYLQDFTNDDLVGNTIIEKCKATGIVQEGETIIVVNGSMWKQSGLTNSIRIITVS